MQQTLQVVPVTIMYSPRNFSVYSENYFAPCLVKGVYLGMSHKRKFQVQRVEPPPGYAWPALARENKPRARIEFVSALRELAEIVLGLPVLPFKPSVVDWEQGGSIDIEQ